MTIDMTILDNASLVPRNRRTMLVENGNVTLAIEFCTADTIINPDGWQGLVGAAVEFVRGAQPATAPDDDAREAMRRFAAEKDRQLLDQLRSPDA